jgi:hypothetical protein
MRLTYFQVDAALRKRRNRNKEQSQTCKHTRSVHVSLSNTFNWGYESFDPALGLASSHFVLRTRTLWSLRTLGIFVLLGNSGISDIAI